MPDKIINLDGQEPVGAGAQQTVYQHPTAPDQLIKVARPTKKRYEGRRPASRRYRQMRIWHLEVSEYLTAMARLGHHFDRMPRMYGFCDTSLGPGYVVERIKTPSGALAPELKTVLTALNGDQARYDALFADANQLFDDLLAAGVEWKDIGLQNALVTGDAGPKLVIVDGIGNTAFIPLTQLSRRIFKMRNQRDRQVFLETMRPFDPSNS